MWSVEFFFFYFSTSVNKYYTIGSVYWRSLPNNTVEAESNFINELSQFQWENHPCSHWRVHFISHLMILCLHRWQIGGWFLSAFSSQDVCQNVCRLLIRDLILVENCHEKEGEMRHEVFWSQFWRYCRAILLLIKCLNRKETHDDARSNICTSFCLFTRGVQVCPMRRSCLRSRRSLIGLEPLELHALYWFKCLNWKQRREERGRAHSMKKSGRAAPDKISLAALL